MLNFLLIPRSEIIMSEKQDERIPEGQMDAGNLYREEIYTDRKAGTIRIMVPVKTDGSPDPERKTVYSGEAQILTTVGALPLSFDIEAGSLAEAVAGYGKAAKVAFERAMRELEEMRRQAASSIVIPKAGAGGFGPGGLPGGGKIQLP
jgi:regulator of protease activity HflC (stomatin/prohibitin superfamily)